MTGSSDRVIVEIDSGVATVTLHNPPLNTFDTALREAVLATADVLHADEQVRAVVLYGGPKSFAAGADVKGLAEMGYEQVHGWNRMLQRTFTRVAELPMPVIAAVTGYALGGGLELALCADFRFAADTAVVGQPEVLLGIMPGAGGTQRLVRLVGPSRTKELLMTGRRVPAAEALELGIVDRVLPADALLGDAQAFARQLADGPRFAMAAIKEAVDGGSDASLAAGLALERSLIAGLFATEDKNVGIASFLSAGPGKARFGGGAT